MRSTLRRRLVLPALALALAGCPAPAPSPTGPDSTGPSFVQVVVRLEAATAPTQRAEFDIQWREIVRTAVGADLTLRVIALVGDPESGISNISLVSDLGWRCQIGPGSQIIGVYQSGPIAFDPITQPASPATPIQINVAANPVAQTACPRTAGKGPVQMRGHVRVVATNGAGMTTASRTFIFDYNNAVGPSTGTDLATGVMDSGTETLYMAECRKSGVPIPPDWSLNSTAWKRQGNLGDDNANLLQQGRDAHVWTYADPAVRGACIVLPRGGGGKRGGLAGMICQGAATGNACFWESRLRDDNNPLSDQPRIDWSTQALIISRLKDGSNVAEGPTEMSESGVCTDCHHGNNVFLIAPDAPTWQKVIKTANVGANFTTRVEGAARYTPITGLAGATRSGWGNPLVPGGCAGGCHEPATNTNTVPPLFATPSPMPPSCGSTAATLANCYR